MDFTDKTVLVTGAGKGIGRATAVHLAALGARIVAMARTQSDLDSLAAEIGSRSVVVDLGDAVAAEAAARSAMPVDFLVNCAGINILEPVVDVRTSSFDAVLAVNLRAPLILSQAYARDRIARALPGAIVNVSSLSAFVGFADHAAYCASKAGLDGMTRVMANELGRKGIRVNCVDPGITLTELGAEAWSDPAKSGPMMARTPVGRFAVPEDIARVIAYLLSDDAAMINGVSMPVEGGFRSN